MNVIVLGVKVPFTRGGQEVLVQSLAREIKKRGHSVELIEIPFSPTPKEHLLKEVALWRGLSLIKCAGEDVDVVIPTKFPSYYVKHPRKNLWLVHQHRAIYDLYGSRYSDFSDDPRDEELRRLLVNGDRKVISECSYISGISKNVIDRLWHYNEIKGEVLYPPLPLGNKYREGDLGDYVLSVGRLCSIKRVDLMIKALPTIRNFINLKIVGLPDEPGIMDYFNNEIEKHHLKNRVQFLGRVSDEDLIDLYAGSLCVYYAPHNEDYGYVTLEAMASGKAVVTAEDSGGVLEFVIHEKNGLVVAPDFCAIRDAVNRLVEDKLFAERLGKTGREWVLGSSLPQTGWENIVSKLLS